MSADKTMQLKVVTPQGSTLEQPAVAVTMWTAMGEIEVLYGHAPTVVLLEPGELRVYDANGGEHVYVAGEGFARIDGTSVTIFSDLAEDAGTIVLDEAEEAKRRAEKALADAANLSEDERAAADLVLRESVVKIEMMVRRGDASRRGRTPRR
jgi:F-type H+-transporting ATPase subunit epsilon